MQRHLRLAMTLLILLAAPLLRADVAPFPSWRVTVNGVIAQSVQVGSAVYVGGLFTKIGVATTPFSAARTGAPRAAAMLIPSLCRPPFFGPKLERILPSTGQRKRELARGAGAGTMPATDVEGLVGETVAGAAAPAAGGVGGKGPAEGTGAAEAGGVGVEAALEPVGGSSSACTPVLPPGESGAGLCVKGSGPGGGAAAGKGLCGGGG